MWSATCAGTQLEAASAYNVVRHSCDCTHGQSGSPMYDSDRSVRVVLTGGNGHGLNWGTHVGGPHCARPQSCVRLCCCRCAREHATNSCVSQPVVDLLFGQITAMRNPKKVLQSMSHQSTSAHDDADRLRMSMSIPTAGQHGWA